nr:MAG TPA: hypothetical protein [Caudoviricetes sp.]
MYVFRINQLASLSFSLLPFVLFLFCYAVVNLLFLHQKALSQSTA